ncbi:MAG: hypothetical protein NTW16_00280 [Bacteroidetes bacterium]|nr:hypothetical protein [Bacteroidota bacterium]
MINIFYRLSLGLLFVMTMAQCHKKEETPVPVNYTVNYQFQVSGGYTDLKIEYYEHGLIKKELTNPSLPWQTSLSNFVLGDSLKLDISFLTVNGTAYNYSGGFTVNQGSVGIIDGSESNPAGAKPIHDQLTYKIH